MSDVVRITTGARLHFGLLDVSPPFGGCGVMVSGPETIVQVQRGSEYRYRCDDPIDLRHQQRASGIAECLGGGHLPHVEVRIIRTAPSHNGLGSGTQLSLAIAEAILCVAFGKKFDHDPPAHRSALLSAADRGRRSAVGTHGYFDGGFLAEGLNVGGDEMLNPVDFRIELPASWRAVVLLPSANSTSHAHVSVSGSDEQAKFDQLPPAESHRTNLQEILTQEIIPAARDGRFLSFVDSVTRYNRASGELFASVQGGPYNGPETTRLVQGLIADGYLGVGQSSWGPGVFVWFENEQTASRFCESVRSWPRNGLLLSPLQSGRQLEVR